jgi:integrase
VEEHRFFSFYPRKEMLYVRFRAPGSRRWGSGLSTGFGITERPSAEYAVRAYLEGLRPSFRKIDPATQIAISATDLLGLERLFDLVRTLPLKPEHLSRIQEIFSVRKIPVEERPQAPALIPFLEEFWDFDKSKYVQRQLATGHRISRRHCYDHTKHVQNHWKKYFGERTIDQVSLSDLEDFSTYLRDRGLKGKTINNVTDAGTIGLAWAFERGLLVANPTAGFVKSAANSEERGVLTPDEAKQLFALEWPDQRAKLGNMLACSCGLRSGEIRSLTVNDLASDDGRTFIARSWNRHDLFTDPKWGSFRDAAIPDKIRKGLLDAAKSSPHPYSPDLLVFSGKFPHKPRENTYLLDSLKETLLKLNPDPNHWKARKIVFHSWRHYFTSRMAEILDEPTLMKATGHKTKDAFDDYVHHMTPEQFERVRGAQNVIFRGIGS